MGLKEFEVNNPSIRFSVKINIPFAIRDECSESGPNDAIPYSSQRLLSCVSAALSCSSSYGQNLDTSTYLGETLFAIFICIGGLILFSLLIGNMQVAVETS